MSEAAREIEITLGVGRRSPRGRRIKIPAGHLAQAIAEHTPDRPEAWWSVHTWEGDHRGKERWQGASGICLDVDYEQGGVHCAPPGDAVLAMEEATLEMPGSLFHHTPRGARVVFVFEDICRDQALYQRACEGAVRLVMPLLPAGYEIDEKASSDLARLMWAPSTIVEGQERQASIHALRKPTYTPEELAEHAQAPVQSSTPTTRPSTLADAAILWNARHEQGWGTHQPCPACEGTDSFSGIPGSHRWVCHHSSHEAPGKPSPDGSCFTGDALDLEAWRRGCKPVDVLRQDGFISVAPAPPPDPGAVSPITGPLEITRSFASLCAILRHDRRIIEEELAWDVMAQTPTIGGEEITDQTADRIREKIELHVRDSKDKGLKFSAEEVNRAIDLVASERKYHPVREYLEGLTWDGTERLDFVPEDYLGADGSELNRILFRKWAISAVARAMSPGCKVDTVLILQGGQGARKSGFFQELVGKAWYASARLDIDKKEADAALTLSRVWVLEWGELDSMQRARDQGALKEFIQRQIDVLRLPYGRRIVRIQRHSVIVGTSNDDDFLADPTGHRRYWIIPTADDINLEPVAGVRDQLWAEAVHRYRREEQWWLTEGEETLLRGVHDRFRRRDPWEDIVLPWVAGQSDSRSSGDILEMCIGKPAGQWTTADARRIAAIMRGAGYVQRKGHRSRVWVSGDAE